uniref:DUF4806 domain-containing protein n=2 Tax=Clastoptera arizonana TaxID=38151 RepID=A0A1B6DLF0_9HEMI
MERIKEFRFYIVQLRVSDQGLQIVPNNWICEGGKFCYWPPFFSNLNIEKAVSNMVPYKDTWSRFPIKRILSAIDNYKFGIKLKEMLDGVIYKSTPRRDANIAELRSTITEISSTVESIFKKIKTISTIQNEIVKKLDKYKESDKKVTKELKTLDVKLSLPFKSQEEVFQLELQLSDMAFRKKLVGALKCIVEGNDVKSIVNFLMTAFFGSSEFLDSEEEDIDVMRSTLSFVILDVVKFKHPLAIEVDIRNEVEKWFKNKRNAIKEEYFFVSTNRKHNEKRENAHSVKKDKRVKYNIKAL